MSTPQQRVVDWAVGEVGYVPSYAKYNKYAEKLDKTNLYNGAKNGYDWCDIFADCDYVSNFGLTIAAQMTNQPLRGCGAGCDFSASYYRAANQWSTVPSIGAQIFFGSKGNESHTGIVVGYDSTYVYTVEGNTGYSEGYSGGAVMRRTYRRDSSRIVGYGIPDWSLVDGEMPDTETTNDWQTTGKLDVDGYLGVQSITAWQQALGTYVDGYVSEQGYEDWYYTPNLVSAERCYDASGSSLVRAIQRKVGASVDGLMGPQTVRCLQAWLNDNCGESLDIDGILGPATAKAVQRSLNDGKWA